MSLTHHLRLLKTDDYLWSHMQYADPLTQPVIYRQSRSSWNEIWMTPVERQVQDELDFYRQEFPLLLNELAAQPASHPG